jgi:hypothetical protein
MVVVGGGQESREMVGFLSLEVGPPQSGSGGVVSATGNERRLPKPSMITSTRVHVPGTRGSNIVACRIVGLKYSITGTWTQS